MQLHTVQRIKKEFEQDTFMRDLLVRLSTDNSTPTDILDSEFGEIHAQEKEFLTVKAEVDVCFSCTIGYDRQVTYYDNGTKKTKTVTDWQPFNGSNHSEEISTVENTNVDDADAFMNVRRAIQAAKESKDESIIDCDTNSMQIVPSALNDAKNDCVGECFRAVNLPGDRQKDKSHSGTASILQIDGTILPHYALTYTYKGQEYAAGAYACGSVNSYYKAPNENSAVNDIAKKKTRPLKWSALGAFLIGIMLNIFTSIGIALIGYGAAIGLVIAYIAVRIKTETSIYSARQSEKKEKLIKLLKEKGYPELTPEEIAELEKV